MTGPSQLRRVHVELQEANDYVARLHRHHKPVVGHRFSLGAVRGHATDLVGVAVVGRPVARGFNAREVVEVTRLCTDGSKNVCSFLYSAAARAGRELGYQRIGTYILDSESGASLIAAGWTRGHTTTGGQWKHTDGKPRRTDQPTCSKTYWYKDLS